MIETVRKSSLGFQMLTFGLCFAFSTSILSQFFDPQSNKDMDTFMYFGTRLLSGELIWVHEFEDKLPIVQFLFVVSAFFDSYKPWLIFSLLTLVISAAFLFKLIEIMLAVGHGIDEVPARRVAMLSCLSYCYMTTALKGGLHHINSMATSLFVIALVVLLKPLFTKTHSKRSLLQIMATTLPLLAIAISIRPYFALPTAFLFFIYCMINHARFFLMIDQ